MTIQKATTLLLAIAMVFLTIGPQTAAGSSSYSPSINLPTESIVYADQFPGSDIGAQINAAYAASTLNPIIWVTASSTFATPISFSTPGKYPLVECIPGTNLQFTGASTSTAVTFNAGTGAKALWGMIGCTFTGSGEFNNQNGIVAGGSNGADSLTLFGDDFTQYKEGLTWLANTNFESVENSVFKFNGQNILFTGGTNAGEGFRYLDNVIADSGNVLNCVNNTSGYGSLDISFNSIDDCQLVIGAGTLSATIDGNHIENPAALSNQNFQSYPPVLIATSTLTDVVFTDGTTMNDGQGATSTPSAYIQNCANITINGLTAFDNNGAGGIVNSLINNCATGLVNINGFSNFNSAVNFMVNGKGSPTVQFLTMTGSNVNFYSQQNGFTGIGTSSPADSLHIQGVGGSDEVEVSSSTGISMFHISQTSHVGINSSTPVGDLVINDATSNSTSTEVNGSPTQPSCLKMFSPNGTAEYVTMSNAGALTVSATTCKVGF